MGGLDTVATNMGLQMLHLAQHPEDQRFLRETPARIPHAIEELMRAYAPVTVFRTCTRDVTFKGVEMKAGEKVAMMTTQIGRAHVCTPVTNAQLVSRLLLEKNNNYHIH